MTMDTPVKGEVCQIKLIFTLAQVANGCDVTKRAIIGVNSSVSGWYYDILTLVITKLLMSRLFGDLSLKIYFFYYDCEVLS